MSIPTDIASLDERAAAYRTIAAALHWLQERAGEQPALAELAAAAGLSEFHLQRLFSRWAGVSPKRFLQHLARERARAALLAGDDILGASLAAGLSGPGRLHDLMVSCEAASPGEIRSGGAGLRIAWGLAATPFGPAFVAAGGRGLMKLSFLEGDDAGAPSHAELQQDWPAASLVRDDAAARELVQRIFATYRRPEPLPLFIKGTQFQLRVWEALLQIPEGRLVTYGALARHLGQPGASRAVGSAVGANPVALVIPCHRVIRASGVLGGYRWGEARKRLLVTAEIAHHAPEFVEPVTKPDRLR
ncbi:MAG: Methylated-DNA--protein-cysteine methyltransferase [Moraxellaceae bacterium]|jgi:AraC family transcriptional regulator of adaptative response/methylated-DNA-[protein]-cysteine methyltransferase|nr:Methylated-DNA--protein-cysteine methyltransferase [Moraxellaceae bacterium]